MADFFYDNFKEYIGDATIDLDGHTFKCGLLDDGHTPDVTHDDWADVSGDEVSGAGYTAGGATLANVTWTNVGGTITFDADNPTWTSASFTARYGVIYDSSASDKLMRLFDFDENRTVEAGTFKMIVHALGLFTLAG